ncbi:MAG TPA: hypothetical protein VMU87_04915 [Stellaceae bacterium]|nr:hypothetical protein [Stellaceae bacterium]
MTAKLGTKQQARKGRRWATLAAGAALLAVLGGCVVYPVGYVGPPHHAYGHGRDWR